MHQRFNKLCHDKPLFSRTAVFLLFGKATLEPQIRSPFEEILVTPWKCNREPVSRRFFQRDKWDRVISNFSSPVVNTGFTLSPFKNEPLQLWSWNNFLCTHKPFFFKAVCFFRVHDLLKINLDPMKLKFFGSDDIIVNDTTGGKSGWCQNNVKWRHTLSVKKIGLIK